MEKRMASLKKANSLSKTEQKKQKRAIAFLRKAEKQCAQNEAGTSAGFSQVEQLFNAETAQMKQYTMAVRDRLHHLFAFVERVFEDGNEMLILVTDLTVGEHSARFIGMFGCEDYARHNEQLMLSERRDELQEEIAALEL